MSEGQGLQPEHDASFQTNNLLPEDTERLGKSILILLIDSGVLTIRKIYNAMVQTSPGYTLSASLLNRSDGGAAILLQMVNDGRLGLYDLPNLNISLTEDDIRFLPPDIQKMLTAGGFVENPTVNPVEDPSGEALALELKIIKEMALYSAGSQA